MTMSDEEDHHLGHSPVDDDLFGDGELEGENELEDDQQEDGEQEEEEDQEEEEEQEQDDYDNDEQEEEEDLAPKIRKRKKLKRVINEFIDDEAELSGDDEVSEDELELSDEDDRLDPDLVDQDAKELDDEEEEEVRRLYHKQLLSEDKRAVLLLQEQLEDNDVAVGQRRRRKFRWQTKEIMENSLRRHYDPNDDDSQEGDYSDDDSEDDYDYSEPKRLRRPTTGALLVGSTKFLTKNLTDSGEAGGSIAKSAAGPGANEDSNSNMAGRMQTSTSLSNNIDRFLFRDKETVQALSTKEVTVISREDKEKSIQREVKRVLQSKSIFDQLYG